MNNHVPETPERTVYFDDECELCERSAKKLRDQIGAHIVGASEDTSKFVAKEDLMSELHAMDENGVMYRGVDAIIVILRWHPTWRWLAPVVAAPGIRQLTGLGYRIVSANRRRWFKKR